MRASSLHVAVCTPWGHGSCPAEQVDTIRLAVPFPICVMKSTILSKPVVINASLVGKMALGIPC